MPAFPVLNSEGKKIEEIDLPEEVFSGRINDAILHQVILMYQANERQGNASTKERGAVRGGGKKPWRQKGTGRARAGSIRSPLWRGGGVVFGPHPRDFSYTLPKKVKMAALRESMNAKYVGKDLSCIDQFAVKSLKTKDFVKILKALKLEGKILAVQDIGENDISKASRNVPFFNLMRAQDINAYDILRYNKLVVTKAALKALLKRIK